jgi:hypothetical protein
VSKQTLTVKPIFHKFQKELEYRTRWPIWIKPSACGCKHNAVLEIKRLALLHLMSRPQQFMLEQEQVEQTCLWLNGGLFPNQLEHTLLSGVEQHVDKLFTSKSHLAPLDASVQREGPYPLARTMDHRSEEVSESLQTTLRQLTSANSLAFWGETGQIVLILNQHQDGLVRLEAAVVQKLELDVRTCGTTTCYIEVGSIRLRSIIFYIIVAKQEYSDKRNDSCYY